MATRGASGMPDERYRIGISGSYGGLNLGDEAILESIIVQLRRSLPVHLTVFSRDPDDTMVRHHVDRVVPVRDLPRDEIREEVASLDLLILGGGGILFDAEASLYLREVVLAQERGVPVMVYAVGAGPLENREKQQLVRDALNRAAAVTVRERSAKQVLEEAGVESPIAVTADPALLLEPEPIPEGALSKEGLDDGERLVGISVREPGPAAPDLNVEHYHQLLANAADFLVERHDATVVFVPMEPRGKDPQHCHAVIAQMARAQRAIVLRNEYRPGELLSFVSRFHLVLSMRLHMLIFAAIQGVPFVALPYAGKVHSFLEALDMPMPPVQESNAGQLIAHIDRAWDLRDDMKRRIEAALPEQLDKARENNRVVVELLDPQRGEKSRKIA